MLIKEYRIPLPLTVEEYRIAQLYMIQKKSREETRGAGSGVEIISNEPFENGPGGKGGQYTYKIYHIGSHLPAWLRSILPSAFRVEEEAWNAYPYTRTKYTCPFVERFVLDVETRYYNDAGFQSNVFDLTEKELQERIIDRIDLVKDPIPPNEYKQDEDPKLYKSKKTGRGPLNDDWVSSAEKNSTPIMCSYKLCKVEFRYWGMQTKIEKYIHEHVLRRTMLHAHRQAWAWQDEWYGLTIDDIRRLERQAQEILNEKVITMAEALRAESQLTTSASSGGPHRIGATPTSEQGRNENTSSTTTTTTQQATSSTAMSSSTSHSGPGRSSLNQATSTPQHQSEQQQQQQHARLDVNVSGGSMQTGKRGSLRRGTLSPATSQRSLVTPTNSLGHGHTDPLHSIRTDSMSEDEFFDAADMLEDDVVDTPVDRPTMVRWSSVEMLAIEEDVDDQNSSSPPTSARPGADGTGTAGGSGVDFLILIFHGGTVMDVSASASLEHGQSKQADMVTLKTTFDNVIKAHYSSLIGRLAFRLVPCPSSCVAEALTALANICPYGATGEAHMNVPEGSQASYCQHLAPAIIPLLASCTTAYDDAVFTALVKANQVYNEFLQSEDGLGFCGEVCIVGDAVGGMLAYDGLVRQRSTAVSRNPSQTSSHSDVVDVSMAIPEDDVLTAASLLSESAQSNYFRDTSATLTQQSNGTVPGHHARLQRSLQHHQSNPMQISERRASSPEGDQSIFISSTDRQSIFDRPKHLTATVGPRRSGTGSCSEALSVSGGGTGGGEGSRPSSVYPTVMPRLEFRVSQMFLCGTPLALVLAHRQLTKSAGYSPSIIPIRPLCGQVYNLYYAIDPCCARLEPLLAWQFARIVPMNVPRYQRFPLGDGQSVHVLDCVQKHLDEFNQQQQQQQQQATSACCSPTRTTAAGSAARPSPRRRFSGFSLIDGQHDATQATAAGASTLTTDTNTNRGNLAILSQFAGQWWGAKRVDYALYCPEGLTSFPTVALPNVLHASFWESSDMAAFVIRQFMTGDTFMNSREGSPSLFFSTKPTEKWLRRRTSFKIKNAAANHRGNDLIVAENQPQVLQARFMYGSLDVVALTGERIDVYIMEKPCENGEWIHYGTETTDGHGRLSFTIPVERRLPYGLYPVKMVVLGDHTYQDMYLAVVPPKTECVVFSIDGSFTASVSVSGKDPKVRPGAVDVVRHWQDLGYLILYVTARPDMQQRKVLTWLAQHNFPHGLLFFTDGISTEPLRQKTQYLKRLVYECGVHIQAGYGSAKDVHMYREVAMTPERIFVVGKASSKKFAGQAVVLSDGYAAHLNTLSSSGVAASRAAQGNGRLLIRKQSFGLPGQYQHRAVAVQRSHSFTPRSTTSQGSVVSASSDKCGLSLTVPPAAIGGGGSGSVSPQPAIASTSQPGTPHTLRSPSPFTRLLSRKGRHQSSNSQHHSVTQQD